MEGDLHGPILGHAIACDYLRERGRDAEAEAYLRRAERQLELLAEAEEEGSEIYFEDQFSSHALDGETLELVRRAVAREPEVRAAHLVTKRVERFPDEPGYYLALVPSRPWIQSVGAAMAEEEGLPLLHERVAEDLELPLDIRVVTVDPVSPIGERLIEVAGSEIFSRG